MITIAIDVDDTCVSLVDGWLDRYNKDYNDKLNAEDITDWNLSSFVKEECGHKIYEYIEDPSIYDDALPVQGALECVKALRNAGYRIVFVTASTVGCAGRKRKWLKDNGFLENNNDYVETLDKGLIDADIIIDDGFHNVMSFVSKGKDAFLLEKPWNKKYDYEHTLRNWDEVYYIILGGE